MIHQSRPSSVIRQPHTHKLPTRRHTNTPPYTHPAANSPTSAHAPGEATCARVRPGSPQQLFLSAIQGSLRDVFSSPELPFGKKKTKTEKNQKPSPHLPSRYLGFNPVYCNCLFAYSTDGECCEEGRCVIVFSVLVLAPAASAELGIEEPCAGCPCHLCRSTLVVGERLPHSL